MSIRCAAYARYSSDKQSPLSTTDQLRVCSEFAASRGWAILKEHTYSDEALSGAGSDRPAFTRMIKAALSSPSPFDLILVDDTSRLSRNLADGLQTVAQLKFASIRVVAISQGIDSGDEQGEVLMTVHGLVDSLFIRELAKKTKRGLEGRVLRGLPAGGRCFGYRNVKTDRVACFEVDGSEAAIVRRIFEMAANGISLKAIARTLNAEGIPAPEPRKCRKATGWGHTTIRGMLHRSLYRGTITWNKTHYEKRPGTNSRVCRRNPPEEWRETQAEPLRIVSEAQWEKAHAHLTWAKEVYGHDRPAGLLSRNATSRYLFSGLLVCSECGGKLAIVASGKQGQRRTRYGCPRYQTGMCSNGLTESQTLLESRLLDALQQAVLTPEAIDYTIAQFGKQLKARLKEMSDGLDALRCEKQELERQIANLSQALADGYSPTLTAALAEREKRSREIADQILSTKPDALPSALEDLRTWASGRLRNLQRVLSSDPNRARKELLKHVQDITLTPCEEGGKRFYTAKGEWNLLGTPDDAIPCIVRVIAGG